MFLRLPFVPGISQSSPGLRRARWSICNFGLADNMQACMVFACPSANVSPLNESSSGSHRLIWRARLALISRSCLVSKRDARSSAPRWQFALLMLSASRWFVSPDGCDCKSRSRGAFLTNSSPRTAEVRDAPGATSGMPEKARRGEGSSYGDDSRLHHQSGWLASRRTCANATRSMPTASSRRRTTIDAPRNDSFGRVRRAPIPLRSHSATVTDPPCLLG